MLVSPEGFKCYHALVFKFRESNNAAEYEAISVGLQLVASLKAAKIRIRTDSCLVVGQLNGTLSPKRSLWCCIRT